MAENDIKAGQASAAQPRADAPAAKKPPNKRVLVVVGVIALLAIGAGGRMWYRSSHFVETENAYVTGRMHQVSSRVAGVVTKVLVEDNQMVKAGDVLALLDPADQAVRVEQIQAQIASMEQQVKQSDAQLLQVRAQAGAAGAQVRQAEAQLLRARQDAERFGQLYNDTMKAVSKSEVDAVERSARQRRGRRGRAPRQCRRRAGPDRCRRSGAAMCSRPRSRCCRRS